MRKMNGDEKEIKRDSWTSSNTNNFGLIILRVRMFSTEEEIVWVLLSFRVS
jgi:hypothetical protein